MKVKTIDDLYLAELRDIRSAEKQLAKALGKLADAASSPEVAQAFGDHLRETEEQLARVGELFGRLGVAPKGKRCVAMQGLIDEAGEAAAVKDPSLRDLALLGAALRIRHYEIAAYTSAITLADGLGDQDGGARLRQSLQQEQDAARRAAVLAHSLVAAGAVRLQEA